MLYRREWLARGSLEEDFRPAPGFTSIAFNQQLRRALAGYTCVASIPWNAENPPRPPYDIHLKDTRLIEFLETIAKDSDFHHFMPWDSNGGERDIPLRLVRAGGLNAVNFHKRGADEAGSGVGAKSPPKKRRKAN